MSDRRARRYPLTTAFLLMSATAARDPWRAKDTVPPFYEQDLADAFARLQQENRDA